jgi:8-oxo-dGTP diphosphatase
MSSSAAMSTEANRDMIAVIIFSRSYFVHENFMKFELWYKSSMTEILSEHFVGKVSQRAVIKRDGKFLLTRDVGSEMWGVPGGRLHKGEAPLAGLVREVKEELGIEIIPQDFIHSEVERYGDGTDVFVLYYRASLAESEQPLVLDVTEVAEAGWFSEEEIQAKFKLWPSSEEALKISR